MDKKPVEVTIIKNGPIRVKGFFSFKNSAGLSEIKEHELYLCRCGGSANKPFCDGSHRKKGVRDQ